MSKITIKFERYCRAQNITDSAMQSAMWCAYQKGLREGKNVVRKVQSSAGKILKVFAS